MATDKKVLPPLPVRISREPGLDWFKLEFDDGSGKSEEIDAVDAVEWFRQHHVGRMDDQLIERAIDDAWNFGEAVIVIVNPRFPKVEVTRTTPRI